MKENFTQILLPGGEWLPSLLTAFQVAGLELETKGSRCYRYTVATQALPIVFDVVRAREVPEILAHPDCLAVAGFSGTDVFVEKGVQEVWILPLLELVPSAPQALLYLGLTPNYQGDEKVLDLNGSRLFTTYPKIARRYLRKNKIDGVSVIERSGKIESLWRVFNNNLAIADISSSRKTARANDIRIVREIMWPVVGLSRSPQATMADLLRINDLQEMFYLAAQNN